MLNFGSNEKFRKFETNLLNLFTGTTKLYATIVDNIIYWHNFVDFIANFIHCSGKASTEFHVEKSRKHSISTFHQIVHHFRYEMNELVFSLAFQRISKEFYINVANSFVLFFLSSNFHISMGCQIFRI